MPLGCIVELQCTASQTDRQTDRRTDRRQYHASSRSHCVTACSIEYEYDLVKISVGISLKELRGQVPLPAWTVVYLATW